MKNKQQLLKDVLDSGVWGTIGPKSESAAKLIAGRVSARYGLLMHSASAALEVQLRSMEIVYGDEVIVASYSDPMDAMVVANVGATPVFADIDPDTATLSAASVKGLLSGKTKAVIADTIGGNPCDMKELADLCNKNGVKVILNLGDSYNTSLDGKPLIQFAYAAVLDISDGQALSAGEGGVLVHNDESAYMAGFAFHNCGRHPGTGDNLDMDTILGGDYRIAEWQAAIAQAGFDELDTVQDNRRNKAKAVQEELASDKLTPLTIISEGVSSFHSVIFRYHKEENRNIPIDTVTEELQSRGYNACRPWRAMHRQPVFSSAYFKKVTGHIDGYNNKGLEHSIGAEETLIWVVL